MQPMFGVVQWEKDLSLLGMLSSSHCAGAALLVFWLVPST